MASSKPPVAVVCVGMAGSGKTTFMQRINAHLHGKAQESGASAAAPYVLNLDPGSLPCSLEEVDRVWFPLPGVINGPSELPKVNEHVSGKETKLLRKNAWGRASTFITFSLSLWVPAKCDHPHLDGI